jgi:AcrR family transcriptional regulator
MAGTSLRSDAVRNRTAIVSAARSVLISDGLTLQIAQVAELAGVGVATIYRNFEDREALITAVLSQMADELLELVEAAGDGRDPIGSLTAAIVAMTERLAEQRALVDIATQWRDRYPDNPSLVNLQGRLGELLVAAQQVGQVRGDVDAEDLRVLMIAVSLATGAGDMRERLVDVIVSGLRPSA